MAANQITVCKKAGVDIKEFEQFLRNIPGVTRAEQVFPGDSDPDMAKIWVVKVEGGEEAITQAMATFRKSRKIVESAHVSPSRRPMGGD